LLVDWAFSSQCSSSSQQSTDCEVEPSPATAGEAITVHLLELLFVWAVLIMWFIDTCFDIALCCPTFPVIIMRGKFLGTSEPPPRSGARD